MFLDAGGQRLEYDWFHPRAPAPAASVLVLLHEGLGSLALWKEFPALLAQASACPVLAYSRQGYGQSGRLDAPRALDYMHREALEVLPAVLDRLGVDAPILVGHSDGASIALVHAGAGLRPVRGVVAMAPHVFVEDLTVASIAAAKVAFESAGLAQKLGRYHDDAAATFRGWSEIWLHPDFRRWNIEDYLPGIVCPLLLIQGEDDQYGTLLQVEAIARQVSGPVETLVLPECGHSPHVDRKQATLDAIASFAARVGERR